MIDIEEPTDDQIRRMAAKLGAPVPKAVAMSDPAKVFIEIVQAESTYHFMRVSPTDRKHLQTVEGKPKAQFAAQGYTLEGMRVIWK